MDLQCSCKYEPCADTQLVWGVSVSRRVSRLTQDEVIPLFEANGTVDFSSISDECIRLRLSTHVDDEVQVSRVGTKWAKNAKMIGKDLGLWSEQLMGSMSKVDMLSHI